MKDYPKMIISKSALDCKTAMDNGLEPRPKVTHLGQKSIVHIYLCTN